MIEGQCFIDRVISLLRTEMRDAHEAHAEGL